MFEQFLKEKRSKWEAAKEQGATKMTKLATYYSGEHVLSDNVKIAQLETWFTDISERIQSLEYGDSTTASRKIQKLMKALENVQEFHQIDSNLQVVQFLQETRQLLRQMIRYINIERKVLITMVTVGDLSYAWELMATWGCFVPEIQLKIKRNPTLAIQMRSAFVKLASMLELPCNRIDQAAGNDHLLSASLESVSEYYSGELVVFVRRVLHIIPISIFDVLKNIQRILVDHLTECPTKLPRRDLKGQSQLEIRQKLSSCTADISKFATGVLAMESTLVGVIQVDPHQLLEDGIRKELIQQISDELHRSLLFNPKEILSGEEFDARLEALAKQLRGIRASFEYIQDYVNVRGLAIWIQEFSRIVHFNVEMECNSFMQKKLYHWKSTYQSDSIPIPYYEKKNESDTYSFLGRIVQHLLSMTDPRVALFVPALGSWYDRETLTEVVGSRTFSSIVNAIGTTGLGALDRLLCFIVARDLQIVIGKLRKAVEPHADRFRGIHELLVPFTTVPLHASKHYDELTQLLDGAATEATDLLLRVGRIQIVRNHIANELRSWSKLNSGTLFSTLTAANDAILHDIGRHYRKPEEFPIPSEGIAEISPFFEASGISDAQSTVYCTSKPLHELVLCLTCISLKNVHRVAFDRGLSCLVPKKKLDAFDAMPFAFGLTLLLKQFHSDLRDLFFGHLGQAVRVMLCDFDHVDPKIKEREVVPFTAEAMSHLIALMSYASGIPLKESHRRIPSQLLAECRMPTSKR
jgi:WASH complex subunit strumpellin